jgi:CBS domain
MAIEALRLMEDGRYRYLPIVDDGKVVSIVSRFGALDGGAPGDRRQVLTRRAEPPFGRTFPRAFRH